MKQHLQNSAAERSQRQLRVGEEIKHALSEVLQRGKFHDPLLLDAAHIITITEVRISPDLKNATAFAISLGGYDMDEILDALNEAAGYIQRELGRKVKLKFTPRLRFVGDDSFANADRIGSLIRDVQNEQ